MSEKIRHKTGLFYINLEKMRKFLMKDMILNFFLRIVFGILGIYVCNTLFSGLGLGIYLGINIWNLLTIGTLGISGFGLVFAVALLSFL